MTMVNSRLRLDRALIRPLDRKKVSEDTFMRTWLSLIEDEENLSSGWGASGYHQSGVGLNHARV